MAVARGKLEQEAARDLERATAGAGEGAESGNVLVRQWRRLLSWWHGKPPPGALPEAAELAAGAGARSGILALVGPALEAATVLWLAYQGVVTLPAALGEFAGDNSVEAGREQGYRLREFQRRLDEAMQIKDPAERERRLAELRASMRDRYENPHSTLQDPEMVPPARRPVYGVYLAGNDMFVGQKKVLGAQKRYSIVGWGNSSEVVGEAAFRDVLGKEFATAQEAKAAYLENMIPGTAHPRPLGLGPVAKFKFDGGEKEHCIENAFRFLE
jgi:hypothetical protein